MTIWYRSTGPIRIIAYRRLPRGGYAQMGVSTRFPAAPAWTFASWTTPVAPDDPDDSLSVGIRMESAGTYFLDDLTLAEA